MDHCCRVYVFRTAPQSLSSLAVQHKKTKKKVKNVQLEFSERQNKAKGLQWKTAVVVDPAEGIAGCHRSEQRDGLFECIEEREATHWRLWIDVEGLQRNSLKVGEPSHVERIVHGAHSTPQWRSTSDLARSHQARPNSRDRFAFDITLLCIRQSNNFDASSNESSLLQIRLLGEIAAGILVVVFQIELYYIWRK